MTTHANVHVVPQGNGRNVKREGATRASSHHKLQTEAVAVAKALAQYDKVALMVHGLDGKIRLRNNYGNDPRDVKG
ncbi:DUF2188 domain-containing protein [Cupriavidus sp. D39]|uniref:DUF2188 domain-containing protein n=1 Tax=Cupriavidus sp. D39 TaxID=2997877 RepID=UPI00226E2536|nr:DUF2188 domain-containing protein [Cupriavidus sp. D39]MCY0853338.1 DUF2188 domain-containing protein [Cupriavidus sp. D39]